MNYMEEYGWGKMIVKKTTHTIFYCIFLLKLTNFMKFTGEEKITTSNHPIKEKDQKTPKKINNKKNYKTER